MVINFINEIFLPIMKILAAIPKVASKLEEKQIHISR